MTTNQTIDGVPRDYVLRLTPEAHSVVLGMVEHCLNVRACMGMDEGFKDFDTEEEHDFVKELRALLDEPVEPAGRMISVKPDVLRALFAPNANAVQLRDAKDAARKAYEDWSIAGQHPAAQPQGEGEPVALTIQQRITWMTCFNADLYEDWLGDNIPEDELQAWLTEEGVPVSLPGSQLAKVLSYELQYANSRLAEQPAPVAVMLPEFESAFEKWWEEDGQYCRAGGGSYEKTFAYRAYEAALSDVTRLNTK